MTSRLRVLIVLLFGHVADRGEHKVRYYGYYSSRSRGERARAAREKQSSGAADSPESTALLREQAAMQRARAGWAWLIARVHEVDRPCARAARDRCG